MALRATNEALAAYYTTRGRSPPGKPQKNELGSNNLGQVYQSRLRKNFGGSLSLSLRS
jgi:hypothetical protein